MPGKRRNAEGQKREIPRNTITAWRKFRGLTLEQLAEATGLSTASLSDMANRNDDVTGKSLLEIATALRTTPGALLDAEPKKGEPFWEVWDSLSEQQRATAQAVMHAIRENS